MNALFIGRDKFSSNLTESIKTLVGRPRIRKPFSNAG